MDQGITKDDLRQFGLVLMNEIRKTLESRENDESEEIDPEWLKSRKVRKIMDMSPNTLQNLRVSGKIRFKKVMGSYYYNRTDLKNLFNEREIRP